MAAACQAGEYVFDRPLQHLLVSKEETEGHYAALPVVRSTVRSASRTSSNRSFSL
jgi:hypothetical protein